MEIHPERCPEYRCHECGGKCAVFVLARDNELRLCESCFETLRDLFQSPMAIGVATTRDARLRVKSLLSRKRILKLRSVLHAM